MYIISRASPKMYGYLHPYGKSENDNMQNYALNVGAHLSKKQKYDIL